METSTLTLFGEFQELTDNDSRIRYLENLRDTSPNLNINFDALINQWRNTKNYKRKASSWDEDEESDLD